MKVAGTLEVSTPSDREIRFIRDFDATPELVFEAHTNPDLLTRWMTGPDGWQFVKCEVDLRVGGEYHYRWGDGSGYEFGFRGVFQEIDRPERLVFIERMDDSTAGEPGALVTQIMEETGVGTRLTMTMRFDSKEARDGALASGMEKGMESGFQRLDDILRGNMEAS